MKPWGGRLTRAKPARRWQPGSPRKRLGEAFQAGGSGSPEPGHVGLGLEAEAPLVEVATPVGLEQRLADGDDGRRRGRKGREQRRFLGGDVLDAAEELEVLGPDRSHDANVGPRGGAERGELARRAGAELAHAGGGLGLEQRERERDAELVVVARPPCHRTAGGRRRAASWTKSCPSAREPGRQTKSEPGTASRESATTPLMARSRLPCTSLAERISPRRSGIIGWPRGGRRRARRREGRSRAGVPCRRRRARTAPRTRRLRRGGRSWWCRSRSWSPRAAARRAAPPHRSRARAAPAPDPGWLLGRGRRARGSCRGTATPVADTRPRRRRPRWCGDDRRAGARFAAGALVAARAPAART